MDLRRKVVKGTCFRCKNKSGTITWVICPVPGKDGMFELCVACRHKIWKEINPPALPVSRLKAVNKAHLVQGVNEVRSGARPPLPEAIRVVLGSRIMTAEQVTEGLGARIWLPKAANPAKRVKEVLFRHPEQFLRVGTDRFRVNPKAPPVPRWRGLKQVMLEAMDDSEMSRLQILRACIRLGWRSPSINPLFSVSSALSRNPDLFERVRPNFFRKRPAQQ